MRRPAPRLWFSLRTREPGPSLRIGRHRIRRAPGGNHRRSRRQAQRPQARGRVECAPAARHAGPALGRRRLRGCGRNRLPGRSQGQRRRWRPRHVPSRLRRWTSGGGFTKASEEARGRFRQRPDVHGALHSQCPPRGSPGVRRRQRQGSALRRTRLPRCSGATRS